MGDICYPAHTTIGTSDSSAPPVQPQYTKTSSKEDITGGVTLLELQRKRSSPVISLSREQRHANEEDEENADGTGSGNNNRLAWLAVYDQRLIDLIYWKHKTCSFFAFIWISGSLLILRTYSIVFLLTAAFMSLLLVMMFYVGASIVLQAATSKSATHPFHSLLSTSIVIPRATQTALTEVLLSLLNGSIDFVGRIVLVQSFTLTFRALVFVWILWAYVSDVYLALFVVTVAVFSVPKLYYSHTEPCEVFIEVFEQSDVTGSISSHFQSETESGSSGTGKRGDILAQSKDVLTASIVGVIVILLVKYFVPDEETRQVNLLSYLVSLYR